MILVILLCATANVIDKLPQVGEVERQAGRLACQVLQHYQPPRFLALDIRSDGDSKSYFYLSLGGPNLNLPQPLDIQTNLDGWGQLSFERVSVCVYLTSLSSSLSNSSPPSSSSPSSCPQVEELGDGQLVAVTMQLIEEARIMARFVLFSPSSSLSL